jgi:hypothetical protein
MIRAFIPGIGTPGPWTAGGRPLTREMVEEVAGIVIAAEWGIHPREINERLNPEAWPRLMPCDRRVGRALQLLRRWGVVRWETWGWVAQPGGPRSRAARDEARREAAS